MKRIQSIFTLLGVDYQQFRTLLKIHIQLDFRSTKVARTVSTGRKKRTLVITLVFYLLPSLMMAIFAGQRSDLFGFAFMTLTLSMIFITLAIIIEFNEIILNPEDSEILTFRPISSRTYFWVKMANLFFYVTVFGLALNLPPMLTGLIFPETNWSFPLLYFMIGWLSQITVASFVIILYSLLVRMFNFEKLKDILAYVQMIFTFLIFVGYQFLIQLTSRFEGELHIDGAWNYFVPPAWFGSLVAVASGIIRPDLLLMSALGLLFVGITLGFAFRNLSLDYAQMIYKLSESTRMQEKARLRPALKQKRWNLRNWLLPDPLQQAGYELVSRYLRRSRTMRTRIYPAFAMPLVIMTLFMIQGEFKDPFLPEAGTGTFMPLLFLIWVAIFFYQILPTSDDWKASWVYYVTPIESYVRIYWGSVKAILLKYITPYFIFVFGVLTTQMPISHAFWVCFFNYLFFLAYYIFMTFFLEDLPLSKKFERGQSNTRFIITFALFPIFLVGGAVEYLVFQYPIFLPVGIVLLLLSILTSARLAGRYFDRKIRRREFLF